MVNKRIKQPKKLKPKKVVATKKPIKKSNEKFRSGFEERVSEVLLKLKVSYEYEPKDKKVPYIIPESNHTYLPDFIANGIYFEVKGRLDTASRKKMLLLKQQHPDKRFVMVLQTPYNKILKGSKTTYAKWCESKGLEWTTIDRIHEYL